MAIETLIETYNQSREDRPEELYAPEQNTEWFPEVKETDDNTAKLRHMRKAYIVAIANIRQSLNQSTGNYDAKMQYIAALRKRLGDIIIETYRQFYSVKLKANQEAKQQFDANKTWYQPHERKFTELHKTYRTYLAHPDTQRLISEHKNLVEQKLPQSNKHKKAWKVHCDKERKYKVKKAEFRAAKNVYEKKKAQLGTQLDQTHYAAWLHILSYALATAANAPSDEHISSLANALIKAEEIGIEADTINSHIEERLSRLKKIDTAFSQSADHNAHLS